MHGSEQRHAPDPKSLAAFGPGDARRYDYESDKKNITTLAAIHAA